MKRKVTIYGQFKELRDVEQLAEQVRALGGDQHTSIHFVVARVARRLVVNAVDVEYDDARIAKLPPSIHVPLPSYAEPGEVEEEHIRVVPYVPDHGVVETDSEDVFA